jgi:type I restriction enzyme S subunit
MIKKTNLPEGWARSVLGDNFDVQLGKMLSEKAKAGLQLPYLANFNVRWGYFDFKKLNTMAFSDQEKKKYKLLKDDLLICEGGEIGRCAVWKNLDFEIYYQKALHRVRPKNDKAITKFLCFYIQLIASQGKLSRLVGETSIPHLTRETLIKLPILLPPLSEQIAIADLLSTWDDAIEKTGRLIEKKEERFRGLLNELIKKPSKNEDWKKFKLGAISKIEKGKQLNIEHMKDDGKYYALNGGVEPSGRTDDWNTEAGTITISEGGNSCGYVNYNLERFWAGGHCYTLLKINNITSSYYLYFYLKLNEPRLMSLRVGSGLPNIQKKDVYKFEIQLPSFNEQHKITEVLFSAQQEIDLLKQLLSKYQTQKRGLMQKLLTGEWRIK